MTLVTDTGRRRIIQLSLAQISDLIKILKDNTRAITFKLLCLFDFLTLYFRIISDLEEKIAEVVKRGLPYTFHPASPNVDGHLT